MPNQELYIIVNTKNGSEYLSAIYKIEDGTFWFNGIDISNNVQTISIPIKSRDDNKIKFYDLNKAAFKKYLIQAGF